MTDNPTSDRPDQGGTQTTPPPSGKAPAKAGAGGRAGGRASTPKMADHIELADTIRQHLRTVPQHQRQAQLDAWRVILLHDANLAAVRALDKLGKVDAARWDVAVPFALTALG